MSYSLELSFEPGVRRQRILEYFAGRKYFSVLKDTALYENPDTGVNFWVHLRYSRDALLRKTVVSAEFEVNYYRPSDFGIEAERELSALVAAFQPRIHDGQINGMGEGPYSAKGFLDGWNFGNRFAIRSILSRDPDREVPSMPGDALRAVWAWNDRRATRREKIGRHCFVPEITIFRIEGHLRRVAVWPRALPILLPRVDSVLVGREVSGQFRYGLAQWPEILDVAGRAGFDTTQDPLDLEYFVTPAPIADWVTNMPLIDHDALEPLAPYQILDEELVTAAREDIENGQAIFDPA